MRLIFYIFIFYYFYIPSQLTLEVINNLYISAASHPGGTKQGRGESSGKFASNISQRKILQRILPKLWEKVSMSKAFSRMEEQLRSTPTIWCFVTNVTSMRSSKAKILQNITKQYHIIIKFNLIIALLSQG